MKIEKINITEYNLQCREAICPFCNHRFMWLGALEMPTKTYYYLSRTTGEYAADTVCPQCGKEMILESHLLVGIIPNEEGYEKVGFRGI